MSQDDTYIELIPLKDIQVLDERQRQFFDYGKLLDLAEDIAANGLLNPIVLRAGSPVLVAGERRLRALEILQSKQAEYECAGRKVPTTHAAVTRISPRSELAYLEAELSENLIREDLTWQEETLAKKKLHELRQRQNPKQTVKDTASEIIGREAKGTAITDLTTDLALASHLDIPEVAKAKTKKEALKALTIIKQREKCEALAEAAQPHELESPHTILHDEATAALCTLGSETFDCILTDPPYGVGADTFGDQTAIDHNYDDSYAAWQALMQKCAKEFWRVAKPRAHAYIFCDIRRWEELADIMELYGWSVWAKPLIWYKGNIGTLPRPNHGPRYTYEAILYAIKGDRQHLKVGHDVLNIPTTQKPRHAAEKPIPLYIELLSRSVNPGETVLDPFAGSGTIFPAANALGLRATGIELNKANYGLCLSRLNERPEG